MVRRGRAGRSKRGSRRAGGRRPALQTRRLVGYTVRAVSAHHVPARAGLVVRPRARAPIVVGVTPMGRAATRSRPPRRRNGSRRARAMDLLRVVADRATPHRFRRAGRGARLHRATSSQRPAPRPSRADARPWSRQRTRGVAGTVHNVVGRLPGRDPPRAVLLVAHYDSVPDRGRGGRRRQRRRRRCSRRRVPCAPARRFATTSSSCSPTGRKRACWEPRAFSTTIPGRTRSARHSTSTARALRPRR